MDIQNPKRPSKPNNKKGKKITKSTERVLNNQQVEDRNLLEASTNPLTTHTSAHSGSKESANTALNVLIDTTMSAKSRTGKSPRLINY